MSIVKKTHVAMGCLKKQLIFLLHASPFSIPDLMLLSTDSIILL